MGLLDEAATELTALDRALTTHPKPSLALGQVLPVHAVVWPADRFGPDTIMSLGIESWRALAQHGPDPHSFADALGVRTDPTELPRASMRATQARCFREDPAALRREDFDAWLIHAVHSRVQRRLEVLPVEDLRIDFEGTYGTRDDAEEDRHATAAAEAVVDATVRGTMAPRMGLRIKPLTRRSTGRAVRTLERFFDVLGRTPQRIPSELVLTLPRVRRVEQVETAAHLLTLIERRHDWPQGRVRLELVIETPAAMFNDEGCCALPGLVRAAAGRCAAVHLDSDDLAQAFGLAPEVEPGEHGLGELMRGLGRLALGAAPVGLSDAVTGPRPQGPHSEEGSLSAAQRADNLAAVHRAWRWSHAQISQALRAGVYQGWDRLGAELPVRYAANYRFFLERFDAIARPLHELLTVATSASIPDRHSDDARRGQRLLTLVRRAYRCGAIGRSDLATVGLERSELDEPVFLELVAARRRRAAAGSHPDGR